MSAGGSTSSYLLRDEADLSTAGEAGMKWNSREESIGTSGRIIRKMRNECALRFDSRHLAFYTHKEQL